MKEIQEELLLDEIEALQARIEVLERHIVLYSVAPDCADKESEDYKLWLEAFKRYYPESGKLLK